ncbi:MAG: DUF1802 family protein [Phormidesmis sp.]
MLITAALKEWSVAVDALATGETILLLRKGGIKEDRGRFSAESDRVLLFPTLEHQKPALLKPQYQSAVKPVDSGWHPQTITLKAWADITHVFLTTDAEQVEALSPFHIWQPQLAQSRLKWKAKQPLYVLLLRAYRLPQPVEIAWQESYSGCRSWLTLGPGLSAGIDTEGSDCAIAQADYQAQVTEIEKILST